MAIQGINHLTLAVVDLELALDFYRNVLGCRLKARWARGAYLLAGDLWLCLLVDARVAAPLREDHGHVAFSLAPSDFAEQAARIRQSGAVIWQDNRSEGESLYFLDPDGHRLEIHLGDLDSRLKQCVQKPYDGMVFYDEEC